MGRGKIEIRRIENPTNRQVTFSKRRGGLLKKAHELAILCDAQVGVLVFSSSGKLFEYCSPPFRPVYESGSAKLQTHKHLDCMHHIIERYKKATNICSFDGSDNYQQQLFCEVARMRDENDKLQAYLRKFTGEDLSSVNLDELSQIEDQLEYSLSKVRNRKHQLMQEQLQNLRHKEHLLEDQNSYLYRTLSEHQASMEHQQQQVVATENKVAEIAMLEHFGHFYPTEEEPRNLLQLSSPQLHVFRLQPTQPNLQDASLHGSGLQL